MDTKKIRTRIAPSPTGDPHIGNLSTAVLNFAFAKQNKGEFIMRTEDTDRERYVEGGIEKFYNTLLWLGLTPNEDPINGGPYAPYKQSQRLDLYKKYALELVENGHAYYCFCTKERLEKMREEQMKNKVQAKYDRKCRSLTKEEVDSELKKNTNHVIRMIIPDDEIIEFEDLIRGKVSFNTNQMDDQVLLKSDGYPTYHLAVVVDDHLMNISHILRAEEWISSTPKHILLYRYFNWEPPLIGHLQVLRNPDKSKMSKRKNNVSMEWYKSEGFLPEAIVNYLAALSCPSPDNKDIFDMDYFISYLSLKKIPKTGPIFDIVKLEWINGVYIRNLSLDELSKRIKPFITIDTSKQNEDYFKKCLELIQERLKRLSEADELLSFFYIRPTIDLSKDKEMLMELYDLTDKYLDKENELESKIREYAEKKNIKAGIPFTTLRDAITGKKATPPLIPLMKVLGKEECLLRIKASIGE